jgi:hypothetical protein
MKNCLLFLAVVAALAIGGPAYSQYVFLDVNGDGLNSKTNTSLPDDVLGPSVTSVDIYIDTNHNRDGSVAVCPTGEALSINSYEAVLHASGSGTVTYGTWTDNMGFTTNLACGGQASCTAGPDIWIGKGSGTILPPNKYKLGTLAITVTGSPVLDIIVSSPSLSSVSETAFGSSCPGAAFDSTLRLGTDFTDADGTEASTPVTATTWGKIKKLYQ